MLDVHLQRLRPGIGLSNTSSRRIYTSVVLMRYNVVMGRDLDMRLLRHFVAVAEELHFSRAAERLLVAQQAVSRDVRRLERQLGIVLFDRTTRRVTLTPAGEELLQRARPLLAHHDDVVRDLGPTRPRIIVDVVGSGTVPARVLARARREEDGYEFYSQNRGDLSASLTRLGSGELDVAFGTWLATTPARLGLRRRLVWEEPLGLLLPAGHPLAGRATVPLAELKGLLVCWRAGNHLTAEWDDVARQLLTWCGALMAEAHPPVRGVDEIAHHVREDEPPVLATTTHPPVPGAVLVPLDAPVPLLPWSMVWRERDRHPGLEALHRAVDEAAAAERWSEAPDDAWRPR